MTAWVQSVMSAFGYSGIALLMFLENVFPPIPSEVIMPFAGFTSGTGELSFAWVVVAGTFGSVVGQIPLYYLGRLVGKERLARWFDRYGRWLTLSADDLERALGWFDRRGGWAVFLCRFVPGIRSLISIPAGFAEMHLAPFLAYSLVGMGAWAAALAFVGWILGENWGAVAGFLGPVPYVVIGVLVVAVAVWVVRRRRRQAG